MASRAGAQTSPNDKLNIAVIGVWGRGQANAGGVADENFYALCDIDERNYGRFIEKFPQAEKAKRENDWRRLLDDENIDAVVISTADHVHALACVKAMQMGMHVYCEKPIAHSVHEARRVREVYSECRGKVATQMGTQIHAGGNFRRVVEAIQAGAIGPVREAHVWCGRTINPLEPLEGTHEIPDYLEWDLWLGPAPDRPYHPGYLPGNLNWNRRWDFGNGVLGDMGSHLIDLPWWALKLMQPTSISAEGPEPDPLKLPEWMIATWEHAPRRLPNLAGEPRGDNPVLSVPVTVKWYHGGSEPRHRPQIETGVDLTEWGNGILFVGDDGSLGHYDEWTEAAKTDGQTLCNFEYSGSLVEHNILGNVAFRVGEELEWDAGELRATNCPEADAYIRREYRDGWTI